jgi:CO/xanthine dehydrogenase FAD-binding subunit
MDLVDVETLRQPHTGPDLALRAGERYLAGGTWLFSEPQRGVTGLVDLTSLGWPAWESLPDGGLRLSATCTIADLQQVPWPLPSTASLARQCADALLMSWKIQYAATLGGNVALGLPAGAMTSLLAGLDAVAVLWSAAGERRVPVAEFVTGAGTTALADGEVIRAFDVPEEPLTARTAFRRHALTDLGRSASVVIGRTTPDGLVVTVTAATPAPVVLRGRTADQLDRAVDSITAWHDDVHGAPDWRASVTRSAVAEVAEELLR